MVSDPDIISDQRFPLVCVVPVTGTPGEGLLYPPLAPGQSGLASSTDIAASAARRLAAAPPDFSDGPDEHRHVRHRHYLYGGRDCRSRSLVALARERGGYDNITVGVVSVPEVNG